LVEHDTLNVGV